MKPLYINGKEVLNLPEQVEKNRKDIEDLVVGNFHLYRHHIELRDEEEATNSTTVVELDVISKASTISLDDIAERCKKPICATGKYDTYPVVSVMYVDGVYEVYYLYDSNLERALVELDNGNTYTEEIL